MIKHKSELSFLILYILTAIFSYILTLELDTFPGELHRYYRVISDSDVLIITIANLFSFLVCFILFSFFSKFNLKVNKGFYIKINENKFHYLFLFLLIAQLVFLATTGVGRVTVGNIEPAKSPYSLIFSILKPEPFIYIYYLYFRKPNISTMYKSKRVLFWFNIICFCCLKLLQGWSSFILILFFLELVVFFKKIFKGKYFLVFIIPFLSLFFGGFIYKYVYVIKNEIRGNSVENISYFEGVGHLSSRLSMNPNSLGAYQNFDKVVSLYRNENIELKEVKAFFRPIVPSGLMDKDFRNLNNNVMTSYTPTLNQFTSSDFGLILYFSILYEASFYDFFMTILISICLFIMAKVFFDTMSRTRGELDFLFFLLLFKFFYTVSLENVFGQGFVPYLFLLGCFYMFGAISFIKEKC
ncbi:oligosaccharide repeat unit polymerase [Pseudoalteromonas sp. SG41-1]|uniref:oligosaccharide repeat unit polymerase n=1 Tax=Pseudoalteromonas sp. SG41-1 TaxID=2760979 RepID=UPI001C72439A|nr:oligosaccharide repeat unit polymerase [Pseudoalteromonas sp. SG41-1]